MFDTDKARAEIPKFMRLPAVLEVAQVGKTMLYGMMKKDEFPKPVKMGRASCWPEAKVAEWVKQKVG